MLNKTPYRWYSKRQTSVEAATFGAEYCAGRVATEEAVATAHMLRSIGVSIDGTIGIYMDNKAVVQNASITGSALKKKHLSIAFHIVREAQAADIVRIYHISGSDNPADIATKSVPPMIFHKHVGALMIKSKGG